MSETSLTKRERRKALKSESYLHVIRHAPQIRYELDPPIVKDWTSDFDGSDYDVVIVSPYRRTRQTARRVTGGFRKHGNVKISYNLCEFHGENKKEYDERDFDMITIEDEYPPLEETWQEFAYRVSVELNKSLKLVESGKRVLWVTHGLVVEYLITKKHGKIVLFDSEMPDYVKRGRDVTHGCGIRLI